MSLPCRNCSPRDQMGCRCGEAKPKARANGDRPPRPVRRWLAEARAAEPNDPEAMALATADADGRPSVRMVLLKGHGPDGFVFYTNDRAQRASSSRPIRRRRCCSTGSRLRRQVRIEGPVERVPDAEADAYFASRARDSQLGAWASDQSRPLDSRATFEQRFEEIEAAVRRAGRAAPAALGRLRRDPRADRILVRPPAPAPRAAAVHPRGGGWSEGLLYP